MKLKLRRPDDWHLHLRDGALLRTVAPFSAAIFGRGLIMPNLVPPITTVAAAKAYRQRILEALPAQSNFQPLMTCYLTDDLAAEELRAGVEQGVFAGAKLYPAGATTNSARGVTDIRKIWPLLAEMERLGLPLLVHGEVVDAEVDIFDREKVFIEEVLAPLLADFPGLRVVLEHITTSEAVDFILAQEERVAATITPHHLVITRNDLLVGGIRPHLYCLPIAKRMEDRRALRKAATSGSPKFFLGTDSAPHLVRDKESAVGRAGIFNSPVALPWLAQVFEQEGALEKLEGFTSIHGAQFYHLPLNDDFIYLERKALELPSYIELPHRDDCLYIFNPPQSLHWRVAENA